MLDLAGKQHSGFHIPRSPAGSTTPSADVAAGAGAGRESKEVVTADADAVMTRCFSTFSFDEGGAAAPATSSSSTSSVALDPSFIVSGYWPTLEGRIWQLYRPLPGGAYGSKEMDVDGGALATSSSSAAGSGLGGW